MKTSSS
jgi:hypothetical protein